MIRCISVWERIYIMRTEFHRRRGLKGLAMVAAAALAFAAGGAGAQAPQAQGAPQASGSQAPARSLRRRCR